MNIIHLGGALALALCAVSASANPMVGGAAMY